MSFCRRPVGDGEPCAEPVMPGLERTCHDHAHPCAAEPPPDPENDEPWRRTCGEPTEYNEIFCPAHYAPGDEGQPTNES